MDEILIEEKKYISSKQAAKITGYAKDYIGQLCREGRVPARLIGRNWYVLEAAIQDHRFGDSIIEQEDDTKEGKSEQEKTYSTWETPRYESISEEILPSINKLKADDNQVKIRRETQDEEADQNIQDSWQAWFDHFGHVDEENQEEPNDEEDKQELDVTKKEEKVETQTEREVEDMPVNVPIRAIFKEVPAGLMPRHIENIEEQYEYTHNRKPKKSNNIIKTIQFTGVLLALVSASIAIIGTGYLDSYILSSSQARIIAGVALYNK